MSGARFLAGLTVVETGDGVAGAVASATLRALGATVTRVVPSHRPMAEHPPLLGPDERGPSVLAASLDVGASVVAEGDAAAEAAVQGAQLLIDDRVDGVGPPDPTAAVERTTVTIVPFGLTGPDAGRPGGELVAQAAGGLMATITGATDDRPVSAPGFVGLRTVGHVAALASMHAIEMERGAGRPVHVEVSAQEAVVFASALAETAHTMFECPGKAGSGRYIAPSGLFPCRDGLVRIAAVENHQWRGVVANLGAPGWTIGLEERQARIDHAELIKVKVAEWTASLDKADCAERLQREGVPATPVNGPAELLESPQFRHRGSIVSARLGDHDAEMPGPPWTTWMADGCGRRGGRLADLHVVEATHVLAGPIVGALLGAMGADVVRLEDRSRLDIYRRTGPFAGGVPGPERGAYFMVANHSKRSVAVEGDVAADALDRLVARSDVLIENVGQSRLDRLGADLAGWSADRGLLTARVSGFGSDGPLAGYRVYANNVQGYGGLAERTRDADGQLASLGTVLADPLASTVAATVVAAWALGPARGRGGVVDLSMAEVVMGLVADAVAASSLGLPLPETDGTDLPPFAPCAAYRCVDGGWLAVSVQTDAEWGALLDALDRPSGLDPFAAFGAADRFGRRRAIDAALAAVVATWAGEDLERRLTAGGVRACTLRAGSELVDDPHLVDRGFFPWVEHPELGRCRLVGLPWRVAGQGPLPLGAPPTLGDANLALGFDPAG